MSDSARWMRTVHMGQETVSEVIEVPVEDLQGTDEENLDFVHRTYCGSDFRLRHVYATARQMDEDEE